MRNHQTIVANCFRIAGWVIGLPSLVSLLGLAAAWLSLHLRPAPVASARLDVGTDGLIALLVNGAGDVGRILDFLLGLGEWLVAALALASLVVTLSAALLYVTGRGIARRSTWARIAGILISAGLLMASVGVLPSLDLEMALVGCLPVGISLYVLWALCWRYTRGGVPSS